MLIQIARTGRVQCEHRIHLPLSAPVAWGQLRDFHCFATHDHFHRRVDVAGGVPRAGAALTIEHFYLGIRIMRLGRVLQWEEGVGYAFSDLSQRGPRRGFPHVLSYQLTPVDAEHSLLRIRVAGRWTSPLPRWMGRLWLAWVFSHVVRSVEHQLLSFALFRKSRRMAVAAGVVITTISADAGCRTDAAVNVE